MDVILRGYIAEGFCGSILSFLLGLRFARESTLGDFLATWLLYQVHRCRVDLLPPEVPSVTIIKTPWIWE